jgi:hypothetical protein
METKNRTTYRKIDSEAVSDGAQGPGAEPGNELFTANGSNDDDLLGAISCSIRQMDYPKPPADFLSSVMKAVESKRMPWWYRAYRWAKSPHSLTITPLRIAPVAALLLACLLSSVYMFRGSTEELPLSGPREGIPVTFTLKLPDARSVNVVGSFNGWRPHRCEMHKNDEATWSVVLRLPEGRHEYAFLVDGTRVIPDPLSEFYQDDGFGNRNNILVVGNNHETAI